MPIPSAQLSDDECSSDDENDETDDTECLLSHDDSETDSKEILSNSESSDGDEEINIQPTDSNSIANKEITRFDSEQSGLSLMNQIWLRKSWNWKMVLHWQKTANLFIQLVLYTWTLSVNFWTNKHIQNIKGIKQKY